MRIHFLGRTNDTGNDRFTRKVEKGLPRTQKYLRQLHTYVSSLSKSICFVLGGNSNANQVSTQFQWIRSLPDAKT